MNQLYNDSIVLWLSDYNTIKQNNTVFMFYGMLRILIAWKWQMFTDLYSSLQQVCYIHECSHNPAINIWHFRRRPETMHMLPHINSLRPSDAYMRQ